MPRAATIRRPLVALLALAAAVSLVAAPFAAERAVAAVTPGTWTSTGSLAHARGFQPAVRLDDGSVLAAGGSDAFANVATAERWSPASGTWAAAGSLHDEVSGQVAAKLPDGKALFAGGTGVLGAYPYGDVYDPAGGTWTQTGAMKHAHAYGAGASLADGDLLVIGGYDGGSTTTATVDRYDAAGGTWSASPALPDARGKFALTATALTDGRVLVAGGDLGSADTSSTVATVQIFDPTANSWAPAESLRTARFDHASVRLNDGRVLVAGGSNGSGTALASSEIFDPASGHWTAAGSMTAPRAGLTLTVLDDGRVLAAGGRGSSDTPVATAEILDPESGIWMPTGSLHVARQFASATLLADDRVLVAGGQASATQYLTSTEFFTPPVVATYPRTTFHALPPMRILDTRSGNGLSGKFTSGSPRSFLVAGRGGVPALSAAAPAVAVTGILTITNQTASGYVTLGPAVTATPSSSTLNFPTHDNRANNVTVALSSDGRLSAVYKASGSATTDLIFDVGGYFTADDAGATFKASDPTRLLDTRNGTGLSGAFKTRVGRTFAVVSASSPVPATAIAVTGNLTVTGQTSSGYVYVGPTLPADISQLNTSTLNTPKGESRANGVTVALAADGTLRGVWVGASGSTAQLVFDVTGWFVPGLSGSHFVPLDPRRVLDTRSGPVIAAPIAANKIVGLPLVGRGVPSGATAVSGNVTVVGQTKAGYVTVARHLAAAPGTSTLNFPLGDTRANGFAVALWTDGSVGLYYYASSAASTNLVIDLTGYFAP